MPFRLLKEDGSALLRESGGYLLAEWPASAPSKVWPFRARRRGVVVVAPTPAPPILPFEVAFATFLRANVAGINAWHGMIPEKIPATTPAIAWVVIDGDSGLNLAGASGLSWRHVQATVYAANPGDVWPWAEALRKALELENRQRTTFNSVHAHPARTGFTPGVDESGKGSHYSMREFFIWYPEARS